MNKTVKSPNNSSDSHINGFVKEILYIGESTRYKIMIRTEKILHVREMNTGARGVSTKEGDKV